MSPETARQLLLSYIKKYDVTREFPLAWVGELLKETPDYFFFKGVSYKEGENPEDEWVPYVVNKRSAECGLVLVPPGPPLEDILENYAWGWTRNPQKID